MRESDERVYLIAMTAALEAEVKGLHPRCAPRVSPLVRRTIGSRTRDGVALLRELRDYVANRYPNPNRQTFQ